jgi:hypothetical protein
MKMTVIVLGAGGSGSLDPILSALQAQTVASELEVILVGPEPRTLVTDQDLSVFSGYQFIQHSVAPSTSEARAAAVRVAKAPIVAFVEDHCFPMPDWAEALLQRHSEDWSGVGPVVLNGNPRSTVSWLNFLIEYGDWAHPVSGGPVSHIPGHNSSYKREALLSLEPHLADLMEAESTMQWKMRALGHEFYLEPKARTKHHNFSRFLPSIGLRFFGGWLFAANRFAATDSKRWLYFLASPLIPIVRLYKVLSACHRLGKGWLWWAPRLPAIFFLLVADGLGESFGYATLESSKAMDFCSDSEVHRPRFLLAEDRQEFLQLAEQSS